MDRNDPGSPPRPEASTPLNQIGEDRRRILWVRGSSSMTKRVQYLRYLVNKIHYLGPLDQKESVVAFILLEQALSFRCPLFQRKYCKLLRASKLVLSNDNSPMGPLLRELEFLNPFSGLRMKPRAFYGKYHSADPDFTVEVRTRRVRRPPPRRFVGVGYRDKGSRRNPATDATPSWQEVALIGEQSNGDSLVPTSIPSNRLTYVDLLSGLYQARGS